MRTRETNLHIFSFSFNIITACNTTTTTRRVKLSTVTHGILTQPQNLMPKTNYYTIYYLYIPQTTENL